MAQMRENTFDFGWRPKSMNCLIVRANQNKAIPQSTNKPSVDFSSSELNLKMMMANIIKTKIRQ